MRTVSTVVVLALCIGVSMQLAAQAPYSGYSTPQHTYAPNCFINNCEMSYSGERPLYMHDTGGPLSGYSDFTATAPEARLEDGDWTHVDLDYGPNYGAGVSMAATLWIDLNNDGDFLDAGELIDSSASAHTSNYLHWYQTFGIDGPRRMRIRATTGTAPTDPDAFLGPGETEDYIVRFGLGIVVDYYRTQGTLGWAMNSEINALGGTQPYYWQSAATGYLISGQLPPGTSLVWQPPWASYGASLLLDGAPTATGIYTFEVEVQDSSGVPITVRNQFTVQIYGGYVGLPFNDDFSTDQAWHLGPTWDRGPASALSATAPARSEPGTDNSPTGDNMILGDTIGGLYPTNTVVPYSAVSPMIDCITAKGVRLRFARWAGSTADSNPDQLAVYVGRVGWWNRVWGSTGGTAIYDNGWVLQEYDLSLWAAGTTVQIRFSVGTIGASQSTGWCIDDIVVEDFDPLTVTEGGLAGTKIDDNQSVGGMRDMGKWLAGQQATDLPIYLYNDGYYDITFGASPGLFAITGANPGDFSVVASGTFQNPLPPGQSNSFLVRFSGSTLGYKSATVSIPYTYTYPPPPAFRLNVAAWVVDQQIGISTQPVGDQPGHSFPTQPVVAVLDAGGSVDATDNSSVITASITSGTGTPGAILYGTVSVTAVGGYATFTNLYIDRPGAGYTLTFTNTNGGLGAEVSIPVDIAGFPPPGTKDSSESDELACSTGAAASPLWAWLLALVLPITLRRMRSAE